MALKRKITKAEFDALADVLKAEYKASGDSYLLDTDDATELVAARDREKEARRAAEKAAKEAADKLAELEDNKARDSGNVAALEASYKSKLAEAEKKATELETTLNTERRDRYITAEASKIAQRFTVPSLMQDQIAKRLQVEMHDGKAIVRVLDKEGKPTANSVADLEKELVDNPEFKAIVIASKATGSAGNNAKLPGGSAPNPTQFNADGEPVNLAKLPSKDLLAHIDGIVGTDD